MVSDMSPLASCGWGGGTKTTVRHYEQLRKPVLLVDGDALAPDDIAAMAGEFVMANEIATLNVAGPRESSHNGAGAYLLAPV